MSYNIANYLVLNYDAELIEDNWMFCCPFCTDTRNRFGFSLEKDVGHCFNCEWVGNSFKFIKDAERLTDHETFNYLKKFSKLGLKDKRFEPVIRKVRKEPKLPKGVRFFDGKYGILGKKAVKYLKSRGLNDYHIKTYGITYCEEEPYLGCLIIPVYENEKLIYWIARKYFNVDKNKYLNPPKTLFNIGKSEMVYNIDNINSNKPLFITEGVFDSISVMNSVAIFGKVISNLQLSKILNIKPKEIIVALDSDAFGKANELAIQLNDIVKTSVIKLPEGADPSSHPHLIREDFAIQPKLRNQIKKRVDKFKLRTNFNG